MGYGPSLCILALQETWVPFAYNLCELASKAHLFLSWRWHALSRPSHADCIYAWSYWSPPSFSSLGWFCWWLLQCIFCTFIGPHKPRGSLLGSRLQTCRIFVFQCLGTSSYHPVLFGDWGSAFVAQIYVSRHLSWLGIALCAFLRTDLLCQSCTSPAFLTCRWAFPTCLLLELSTYWSHSWACLAYPRTIGTLSERPSRIVFWACHTHTYLPAVCGLGIFHPFDCIRRR